MDNNGTNIFPHHSVANNLIHEFGLRQFGINLCLKCEGTIRVSSLGCYLEYDCMIEA